MKLTTPTGLTGTITDMHIGNKIDFLNTAVTSVHESGNVVTVDYGTNEHSTYLLAGKEANTHFALQSDLHGGTELILIGVQHAVVEPLA